MFLLEGDEYPSSNTDDRSKFLHYAPAHLILTPLAHDHVNVFPTVESYLAPFHQLMELTAPDGLVLAAVSGELSRRFLEGVKRPVTTFGVDQGEWQAGDIRLGERSRFILTRKGAPVVEVETGQLGLHNIENMVGIGAFVLQAGNLMQTDQLLAGVVILSLFGLAVGKLINLLETRLLHWR
jgi:UDP-N-acetylmuramate: L-alanyl-gamma-D-glutamyl-meso-diaminopimelate ligase